METSNLQLTPEMREALLANPGVPVHIADEATRKVYLLVEQGAYPELEEEYVRQGLELARGQIARGEVSTATIDEVIDKARQAFSQQS
jgi:Arc/MetJ-type ribon-helix-helix transcriptional regulator